AVRADQVCDGMPGDVADTAVRAGQRAMPGDGDNGAHVGGAAGRRAGEASGDGAWQDGDASSGPPDGIVELPRLPPPRRLAVGTAPIAPQANRFFSQLRYLGQLDLTYL